MVSGPNLPIYIIIMDKTLLETLKSGVIPVESPTVPNALVISNIISVKSR